MRAERNSKVVVEGILSRVLAEAVEGVADSASGSEVDVAAVLTTFERRTIASVSESASTE